MDWKYFVENFQFVNIGWAFLLPLALEAIDFLTGYVNACIKHERSSSRMREGGGKKFSEAMCLLVAQLFTWAMNLPTAFVYGVSLYICLMEFISIIENIKKLGVPVPGKVDHEISNLLDDLKPNEGAEIEHSATDGSEEE